MSLCCARCHKEVQEPMEDHRAKCLGPAKEKVVEKTIFLTPEEVNVVSMALGLLNSMILSGEHHSNTSRTAFRKAIDILSGENNEQSRV